MDIPEIPEEVPDRWRSYELDGMTQLQWRLSRWRKRMGDEEFARHVEELINGEESRRLRKNAANRARSRNLRRRKYWFDYRTAERVFPKILEKFLRGDLDGRFRRRNRR